MQNDVSDVKLTKEQQQILENTLKLGIYKAMLAKGLITDRQLYTLLANKEALA